jgi:hypothetical protein
MPTVTVTALRHECTKIMSKNYYADNSEQQQAAEHPTEAENEASYTRSGASIQKRIVLVHQSSVCNFENLSRIFVSHWLEKNTDLFTILP